MFHYYITHSELKLFEGLRSNVEKNYYITHSVLKRLANIYSVDADPFFTLRTAI